MSFDAQDVVTRARDLIQDTAGTRWTTAEMLRWVNDALRVIIAVHPQAFAKRTTLTLVQGSFQQLGTTHYRLLRMLGGLTRVDMDRLDAVEPDWRDQSTVAKPVHYMYDEDTPKEFYVYPPVQPGVQVTANIAVHPVEIDDLTDLVPIDDMYQPVIVDYLIHRAYGKHSKAAGNQANSDAAFMRFAQALGVKLNVLAQASPNNETVPS